MKRDMDLVRTILLKIEEEGGDPLTRLKGFEIDDYEDEEVAYHLWLLNDAGFIIAKDVSSLGGFKMFPACLTWNGHEFLNAIRDPLIWQQTKAGAKQFGGASIEFVWDLAKAYGKHLAKERLGFELS